MGIPCIDFSLTQIYAQRVGEVVVNVHAHSGQMNQHLAKISGLFSRQSEQSFKVTVSDESQQLLGSAGGIKQALPFLKEQTFFAMNADSICAVSLAALEQRHLELKQKHGVVMTLVLASGELLQKTHEIYREIHTDAQSGLITGFGEKKQGTAFYTGVAVFETKAFEGLSSGQPAEFVPDVLEPWIKKGKVGFLNFDGLWLDIGSPELWWLAHQELKKKMMLEQAQPAPNGLPSEWHSAIQSALHAGKVGLDTPWFGWVHYGKDATPQNFLGKKGIQLHTLCYEVKSSL